MDDTSATSQSAWVIAAEELRKRARARRADFDAEEPKLLDGIEAIFRPAIGWYFGTLRARKIRPWAAHQGPDESLFTVSFVSEWRVVWVRHLQERLKTHGSFALDAKLHVASDLFPSGGPVMTISISEDFVLSARALHLIGEKARASLPSGTRFPRPAARWLELLGYEIVNAETPNAP